MTLRYELKFFDYWHAGSGLSGGAALDNYVIKDSRGLPYMPGKTIKGLAREVAEMFWDESKIHKCFGKQSDQKGQDSDDTTMGECYFSNATIEESVAEEITANNLTQNLFDLISSTRIDENGIAVDKSLRDTEVTIPVTLQGSIDNISQDDMEDMKKALKMIKRAGLNRNRGLGRCEFVVKGQS
ncbi:RAMP superfamily CRISPR-associated protein [Campylobacter sp. RM16190]|uniref:RAMP superfamily CRISPR-associated protein n=1 Tax=Campylobacter sp. RM16190 TaxID=1705727 RepID=UPI0014731621|nr:RAMP superfamily CRISPR-associated protein [Campylobacter sp. RM16190]